MPNSVKPQSANSYTSARGAQDFSDVVVPTNATHSGTADAVMPQKAASPNAIAGFNLPKMTPPRRKTPPPRRISPKANSSITGSPLLDSFATSAKDETIFIPNYQLVGNRFGERQRTNFENISLKFSGTPSNGLRPTQKSDRTSAKIEALTSHNHPVTQVPKTTTGKTASKAASQGTAKTSQSAAKTTAKTYSASPPEIKQTKPVNKGDLQNPPTAQPVSQASSQSVKVPSRQVSSRREAPPQAPFNTTFSPQKTHQNSHNKPSQKSSQKVSQNPSQKASQKSSQNTGQQANSPSPSVYSGSQYRANQARAAAGGLVDLEDTLLFGGSEKNNNALNFDNTLSSTKNSHPNLLVHLISNYPPPFSLTKSEGNRAILDDFSALGKPDLIRVHTVLNAKVFAVFDPPAKQGKNSQNQNQQNESQNTDKLNGLTQQIHQLHQKIEYLSEKLASLNDTPPQAPIISQE